MKYLLISGSILFMLSCKLTSFRAPIEGKYFDEINNHELTLNNDKTFTYVTCVGLGPDTYWDTYLGAWSYLNDNVILLSFPHCPEQDIPLMAITSFDPYRMGGDVKVHLLGDKMLQMDSLSNNAVLTMAGK